jgi:hypothetical protein
VSIAATATGDSLSRFQKDVVPYQPDFVVFSTSLWNEGFALTPAVSADQYLRNTRQLVQMAKGIRAVPVVVGPYPNSLGTSSTANSILDIYNKLESLGIPICDFWNGLASDQGAWLPNLTVDGIHPTDTGHQLMFDAIPLSLFLGAHTPFTRSYASDGRDIDITRAPRPFDTAGSWVSNVQTRSTVSLNFAQWLGSWSLGIWFRHTQPYGNNTIFMTKGTTYTKLVESTSGIKLLVNEVEVLSSPPISDPDMWHHLLVSYRQYQNILSIYLDGVTVGRANVPSFATQTLSLGDSCDSCRFNHLLAYRTGLVDNDVVQLFEDHILRKSLEFWAPMNKAVDGEQNRAGTSTAATLEGQWEFLPFSGLGHCPLAAPPSATYSDKPIGLTYKDGGSLNTSVSCP